MANKVVTTKLGNVEYRCIGSGRCILIVHGGHSNSCEELFLKGLDPGKYRVIIPSRPGYGQTPLDGHKTPKAAADLIICLLDNSI